MMVKTEMQIKKREWDVANKEHRANYTKRYTAENREAIAKHRKAYYQANKSVAQKIARAWYKNNMQRAKALSKKSQFFRRKEVRIANMARYDKGKQEARLLERHRAYPERAIAKSAVSYAVKHGTLIKPICCSHCGHDENIWSWHDDLFDKLNVKWYCGCCHMYLSRNGELPSEHVMQWRINKEGM